MTQPQELDHYRQIAKLFRTLNKRSTSSQSLSKNPYCNKWPNASIFSLLNKTQKISNKISKPSQTTLFKRTYKKGKEFSKTRMTTTVSVVDFDRPITCESRPRTRKTEARKQNKIQSSCLFEIVKKQKLDHLQGEKQQLIRQIFNQQKNIIHRIDQDEEDINKPNAINFKTYFSLNKLMDLKNKIYHTANYRPKTGGERIKRTKINSPFV